MDKASRLPAGASTQISKQVLRKSFQLLSASLSLTLSDPLDRNVGPRHLNKVSSQSPRRPKHCTPRVCHMREGQARNPARRVEELQQTLTAKRATVMANLAILLSDMVSESFQHASESLRKTSEMCSESLNNLNRPTIPPPEGTRPL